MASFRLLLKESLSWLNQMMMELQQFVPHICLIYFLIYNAKNKSFFSFWGIIHRSMQMQFLLEKWNFFVVKWICCSLDTYVIFKLLFTFWNLYFRTSNGLDQAWLVSLAYDLNWPSWAEFDGFASPLLENFKRNCYLRRELNPGPLGREAQALPLCYSASLTQCMQIGGL